SSNHCIGAGEGMTSCGMSLTILYNPSRSVKYSCPPGENAMCPTNQFALIVALRCPSASNRQNAPESSSLIQTSPSGPIVIAHGVPWPRKNRERSPLGEIRQIAPLGYSQPSVSTLPCVSTASPKSASTPVASGTESRPDARRNTPPPLPTKTSPVGPAAIDDTARALPLQTPVTGSPGPNCGIT